MGYTLESFASECHDILADDPGVTGREKVRVAMELQSFIRFRREDENAVLFTRAYFDLF